MKQLRKKKTTGSKWIPASTWLTGSLTLALVMGSSGVGVHAQPNAGNGPGQGQRADFRNLTPEQRTQLMQQVQVYMREVTLRMMLDNAAVTEKPVQDAIVTFARAQDLAVQPLREQNRKVMQAMNDKAVPETQVASLLKDFRTALAAETVRRQTALEALDAQINYSKQPRLSAVLMILGLNGDEMALVEGAGGGMGGFGGPGMGGFGGGFGGGPGGQGGGRGGGGRGGQGGGAQQ